MERKGQLSADLFDIAQQCTGLSNSTLRELFNDWSNTKEINAPETQRGKYVRNLHWDQDVTAIVTELNSQGRAVTCGNVLYKLNPSLALYNLVMKESTLSELLKKLGYRKPPVTKISSKP